MTSQPEFTLQFANDYSSKQYKLFELPDDLLKQIEDGSLSEMVIKAPNHPNQNVILCTKEKTYAVTSVETSNTVLLRNKSHPTNSDIIQGSISCFYEITEKNTDSCINQLEKTISQLLSKRSFYYSGNSTQDEINLRQDMMTDDESIVKSGQSPRRFFSLEDLESLLMASRSEIIEALRRMNAIQVGNYWRLIDPNKFEEYCTLFFLTLQSEGWKLNQVPVEQCLKLLEEEGHDPLIMNHVMLSFCDRESMGTSNNNNGVIALDIHKITVHYAKVLLSQKRRWLQKSFVDALRGNMSDIFSYLLVSDSQQNPKGPPISHLIKIGLIREEESTDDKEMYIIKNTEL
jgi:hypothetical protein